MTSIKERWEITQNWQYIYIILALIATGFSAYLIARPIVKAFSFTTDVHNTIGIVIVALIVSVLILKITFWLFKFLYKKWDVSYRWELIAIFLAFAVTGSTAGKLSDPLMELIGLSRENTIGWLYWPVRIVLIFPIYQILLIIFGWIFGQFKFFWNFEKKMLRRMGFARFLNDE